MTLTEFLLARIAEDEWRATRMREIADDYGAERVGYEWVAFTLRDGRWERAARMPNQAAPTRVLAECEAKRRVVEMCADDLSAHSAGRALRFFADDVLARLALTYADHPDYRPEWRP